MAKFLAHSLLLTEEVFLNRPILMGDDLKHSIAEKRWYALGKTFQARCLFVIFTLRQHKIRVISARNANIKERRVYEKEAF